MLLLPPMLLLSTVMLLLLLSTMVAGVAAVLRGDSVAALEVDVDAAGVLLGTKLESQLAAQLLDLGLDLLDVARRVMALADDGMQVRLAGGLVGADALLEDALSFLDELAVQIDAVGLYVAGCVVLAEDEVGGLLIVVVHLGIMRLALVGELLRAGAIAVVVRLSGL